MTDWLRLQGLACVVTGGAGGIGRAIGAGFAGAGARVALLDRDGAGAEAAAAALRAGGAEAIGLACDTTDPAAVEAAAAEVQRRLGAADVLVNNAGILRPGPLESLSLADWNQVLAVNLTGYLLCAQAFGRQMRARRRGAMVHVASIAALEPQTNSGAYSASKSAVAMLSRQIAAEWGPWGIRSNAVCPGLVRTPMSQAFYAVPGVEERRKAMVPVRRIAEPEDIADAVLFLASARAAYVNGATLLVDGGLDCMLMDLIPRPGFERAPPPAGT
ncbi:SDR family NAD(P)-dependent oxidoreductase [Caldovatus aquaticus]|uniref:Glucose 1-dehydrogenase n=1 Tax=Caldovatus aquaticus TaxID=2865671 RepID=A0ABS7F5S0_9PROT|nr:glucose 1-dehydrogenase [Caldovatus aquaticus]MBW8270848.1 glucose 1-dehydrogenase [Caldovatus aquaticus]